MTQWDESLRYHLGLMGSTGVGVLRDWWFPEMHSTDVNVGILESQTHVLSQWIKAATTV